MDVKRSGSQPSGILLRRGYGGTRRAGHEEVTNLRHPPSLSYGATRGYGLASE